MPEPIIQGMAKEAPTPQVVETTKVTPVAEQSTADIGWNGVPMSVYRFFNVDFGREEQRNLDQIKEVYNWAKDGISEEGDMLRKISSLQIRLGAPGVGQQRHTKLYNWVLLNRNITNLLKQREALIS